MPTGRETLERITGLSGGELRTDIMEVFQNPPRSARTESLLAPLMIVAVVLLLLEIAGRRLALWQRIRDMAPAASAESKALPERAESRSAGWLSRIQWARTQRKKARTARRDASAGSKGTPEDAALPNQSSPPEPDEKRSSSDKTAASVFEQARKQARRRFKN